jgi:hypothetical protein
MSAWISYSLYCKQTYLRRKSKSGLFPLEPKYSFNSNYLLLVFSKILKDKLFASIISLRKVAVRRNALMFSLNLNTIPMSSMILGKTGSHK